MNLPPTRIYEGRHRASLSFRIYGGPDHTGQVIAEGNGLTTEEMLAALIEEAKQFGGIPVQVDSPYP